MRRWYVALVCGVLGWASLGYAKLVVIGCACLALAGCADFGYAMNRAYGLDCRPEVVRQTGGTCAATSQKGS